MVRHLAQKGGGGSCGVSHFCGPTWFGSHNICKGDFKVKNGWVGGDTHQKMTSSAGKGVKLENSLGNILGSQKDGRRRGPTSNFIPWQLTIFGVPPSQPATHFRP